MSMPDPLQNRPDSFVCDRLPAAGTADHLRYFAIFPTTAGIQASGKRSNSPPSPLASHLPRLGVGVLAVFDQEWQPRGLSRGKLVGSVFVPPGPGKVEVTERSWQSLRSERADTAQLDAAFSRSVQSRDSDSNSVSKRTAISRTRTKSGTAGIKVGSVDIGGQVEANTLSQSSVDDVREFISEQTENAAWEERRSRVSSVNVVKESGAETTTVRTFHNPSLSRGVSYDYYETLQNYTIFTTPISARLVLLVPRPAPRIDAPWLRCHEWILKATLKLPNSDELFDAIRWVADVKPAVPQNTTTLDETTLAQALDAVGALVEHLASPIPPGDGSLEVDGKPVPCPHALHATLAYAYEKRTSSPLDCVLLAGDVLETHGWSLDFSIPLGQWVGWYHGLYSDWWAYDQPGRQAADVLVTIIRLAYEGVGKTDATAEAAQQEDEFRRMERAVEVLRCHIREHLSYYLEVIWTAESPADRARFINTYYLPFMPSFWNLASNDLICVHGDCLVLPFNETALHDKPKVLSENLLTRTRDIVAHYGKGILSEESAAQGERLEESPNVSLVADWVTRAFTECQAFQPRDAGQRVNQNVLCGQLTAVRRAVLRIEETPGSKYTEVIRSMVECANEGLGRVEKELGRAVKRNKALPKGITNKMGPGLRYPALRRLQSAQQYVQELRRIEYSHRTDDLQTVLRECERVNAAALDARGRQEACVFVQLPTPALSVEPRLTVCEAWAEDVERTATLAAARTEIDNKIEQTRSERHEKRLLQEPPDFEAPDCCKHVVLSVTAGEVAGPK